MLINLLIIMRDYAFISPPTYTFTCTRQPIHTSAVGYVIPVDRQPPLVYIILNLAKNRKMVLDAVITDGRIPVFFDKSALSRESVLVADGLETRKTNRRVDRLVPVGTGKKRQ